MGGISPSPRSLCMEAAWAPYDYSLEAAGEEKKKYVLPNVNQMDKGKLVLPQKASPPPPPPPPEWTHPSYTSVWERIHYKWPDTHTHTCSSKLVITHAHINTHGQYISKMHRKSRCQDEEQCWKRTGYEESKSVFCADFKKR